MSRNSRHVVPNPTGGWDALNPSNGKRTNLPTQADAERYAKRDIGGDGGGEVVIHRPDGTIRDSDTVAPARDPFPPRDTQH